MRHATLAVFMLLLGCPRVQEAPRAAATPRPGLASIFVPARAGAPGPAPTVVLLHGLGADERDLVGLGQTLDPRFALVSFRAPIALEPRGYSWFPVTFTAQGPVHDEAAAEAARGRLVEELEKLRKNPAVDASQVYLVGFSQGAILSLSVALTEPRLIAGAVILSGRTLPEVAARVRAPLSPPPPILVLHGRRDALLAFENEAATVQVLTRAGFAPEVHAYDAGHEITQAMQRDLSAWLTARLPPEK